MSASPEPTASSGERSPDTIRRDKEIRLAASFSEFRHSLNNSLAVMMALAEMAQRDPSRAAKLSASVLEKSANIIERLREFTAEFNDVLRPERPER